MSLVLWLISKNLPLGHYERYSDESGRSELVRDIRGIGWGNEKEIRRVAGLIVNALSQYKVAELVAKEWEGFPPRLRMDITDIANGPGKSGNVRKGIVYLDQLLGGRVLSRQIVGPVRRDLRTVGGVLVSRNRRIDPAVAGAERAHAAFARPAHYHKMSPAEKRKVNQQLAADRRRDKKVF